MKELPFEYRVRSFAVSLLFGIVFVSGVVGCAGEPPKRNYSHQEKARMLVEIANAALQEGDPTGALQDLRRAEKEDENLPELHHSLALAYYAKHDLKNAVQAAKKATQIKPDYADANTTLGKLLMEEGKYSEAIPPLKSAADDLLNREAFKAMTNLGILNYRRADFAQAEVYFNRAVKDAPAMACVARYYLGNLKLRTRQLNEAIENYSEAKKGLCAHFGEAHLALGMAYQQNHQTDLARKTFLEIQKLYPNTSHAEKALDQLRYLP